MLRGISCLATASFAVLLSGLLILPAAAQKAPVETTATAKPPTSFPIAVTDSAKDVEILVAKLLKDSFNLESSLKIVNDNPDNLRLQVPMGEDKNQGIPRIVSVIDTAIVARDKDGKAISQTITIAATADITFTTDQLPKLLEWANAWNARMYPIRVFVGDARVYTGASVLSTRSEPSSSDRVVGSFLGVVRAWTPVIRDLRAQKLVPEKN